MKFLKTIISRHVSAPQSLAETPNKTAAAAGNVRSNVTTSRRGALSALGGLSATALLGCGGGNQADVVAQADSGAGALVLDSETETSLASILATPSTCTVVASETEGPFPLRAILANAAMVRADITEGRPGAALTLRVKLIDVNNACAAIPGAWVYLWHTDRDGLYSGYSSNGNSGQVGLTYMRGIQQADADGVVTFKTIIPGWYQGRITHMHCMVFLAGTALSSTSSSVATTQFAFPAAVVQAAYASNKYTKGQNTSVASNAADGIFSDGTSTEMLRMSGSAASGFAGGIVLGINANGGGGNPPAPPTAPATT